MNFTTVGEYAVETGWGGEEENFFTFEFPRGEPVGELVTCGEIEISKRKRLWGCTMCEN